MHYYNLGQASGAMITNGWYAPYLWDTTATCNQLCAGAGTWKCAMPDKFGNPRCTECSLYDYFSSQSTVTCLATEQECLDNCDLRVADDGVGKTISTPMTTTPQSHMIAGCVTDGDCEEDACCVDGFCEQCEKNNDLIQRMQDLAKIK